MAVEFRILSNVRIAPKYFGIALIRNTNEINLSSKIHSRGPTEIQIKPLYKNWFY
jgi:hypothetical protein